MAGRIIAQLLLAGSQVVGRAFMEAYRQAVANAGKQGAQQAAGAAGAGAAAGGVVRNAMSLEEAAKILNLDKGTSKVPDVTKNFEHLFKANDPAQGGSFYLQSKVVRAKERFEHELKVDIPLPKVVEETPPPPPPAATGGPPTGSNGGSSSS